MKKKRNVDWSVSGREADMQKRNLNAKQQPRPFMFTKIARTASESMSIVFHDQCLNYIRLGRLSQCIDWYSGHPFIETNVVSICHNHFPVPYLRVGKIMSDEWYRSLYKFAFVRNPWDRLVSYWRLYFSSGPTSSVGLLAKGCDNFSQFVHKCVDEHLVAGFDPFEKCYNLVNPQWRWILPSFDFVGCYEYLQRDWNELNRNIGTVFVLNRHSKLHSDCGDTRRHYVDYYDSTTAKLVETLYESDIEIFGYDSIECNTPYDSCTILNNLKDFWGSYVPKKRVGFGLFC